MSIKNDKYFLFFAGLFVSLFIILLPAIFYITIEYLCQDDVIGFTNRIVADPERYYGPSLKFCSIMSLYFSSAIAWGLYAITLISTNSVESEATLDSGFTCMNEAYAEINWKSLEIDEFSEEDRKDMTFENFDHYSK